MSIGVTAIAFIAVLWWLRAKKRRKSKPKTNDYEKPELQGQSAEPKFYEMDGGGYAEMDGGDTRHATHELGDGRDEVGAIAATAVPRREEDASNDHAERTSLIDTVH